MGIKDIKPYLERMGYVPGTVRVEPGSIVLVDAMMLLHSSYGIAVLGHLGPTRTRENTSTFLETQGAAKTRLVENMVEIPRDEIFDENRVPRLEALARPADVGGAPAPWIAIREAILVHMASHLCSALAAGLIPVLVWDPPIYGGPRTDGKVARVRDPMVLRAVDRTWIYASLRLAGFPTAEAWTEGEKAACAAAQAGAAQVVVSGDTDCIVLGTGAAALGAGLIELRPGNGGKLDGAISRERMALAFERVVGTKVGPNHLQLRLLDAAIFLGNDFSPRLNKNGPAAIAQRTASASPPYHLEVLTTAAPEHAAAVKVAISFFTVTDADRARGVAMVEKALKQAWVPKKTALGVIGAATILERSFEIIQRGPPQVMQQRDAQILTGRSGAEEL
jgi:hypothetical protein